jgi:hypothetical protein
MKSWLEGWHKVIMSLPPVYPKENRMATKSKFAKRLAGMQKKYDAAQAPASPGECALDPGRYRAKIHLEMKELNNKFYLDNQYEVVEGDFEGEKASQLDGLDDDKSLGYLKKKLKQFGYDPEMDLAESLEATIDAINERELVGVIQVKQNGDYTNVYLNKVELDEEDEDAEEEAEEEVEEEESEDEAEESDDDENDSEEEESDDEEEAEEEEAEEEETEEVSFEKGETVLYQRPKSKKATEHEIVSINEKKGTCKLKGYPLEVKLEELQKVEVEEADEEDVEEEDEDTAELEVGSKVSIDNKGKSTKGVVKSIDEDSETAKVKCGDKIYKVSFDQITVLTDA